MTEDNAAPLEDNATPPPTALDRNDDPAGSSIEPEAAITPPATPEATPPADTFSWKGQLSADMKNSTVVSKFDDTPDGLAKAVESHANLERLLGHEKVPIPKGDDDHAGWHRFHKAMGVPETPDGYKLPDIAIPEEMTALAFNKKDFADAIHGYGLTPKQADGVWGKYTEVLKSAYANHLQKAEEGAVQTRNEMLGEWGEAYEANVELGQLVINKFSSDKGTEDFITAQLGSHPMGIKFLAKIGSQFSEAKVGEFGQHRFAKTPDEAESEIARIMGDMNHPYMNDKAPGKERTEAINYVNSLYASIAKSKEKK